MNESPPSWNTLRQVWKLDPQVGSIVPQSIDIQAICDAETRRLRLSVLSDWVSALIGSGFFLALGTQAESVWGRTAFALVVVMTLLYPLWTRHTRRSLWQASADTPQAYWTLRANRARHTLHLIRIAPWVFLAGCLIGIALHRGLAETDTSRIQPLVRGWMFPGVVVLLVPFTIYTLWQHRQCRRVLLECQTVLADLDQDPEPSNPQDGPTHKSAKSGIPGRAP